MFWLIVFVVLVAVLIAAGSASGAQKAASTINAMAQMVGSEERFREYWRFVHKEMIGAELPRDREEQIVRNHLKGYLKLIEQFRSVTPDNVKVVGPALASQSDNKEIQIATDISPQFGKIMSSRWKRERAQKKYARSVLGLNL